MMSSTLPAATASGFINANVLSMVLLPKGGRVGEGCVGPAGSSAHGIQFSNALHAPQPPAGRITPPCAGVHAASVQAASFERSSRKRAHPGGVKALLLTTALMAAVAPSVFLLSGVCSCAPPQPAHGPGQLHGGC
jgi:hypothetical protein